MQEINGATGEGGGQVLRTSLSLSVLTGQAIHLRNIRKHRPQAGLKPQHLEAVHAARSICRAEVAGARRGSYELYFTPGQIRAGSYGFDIGTAGSTGLVLQTIALPLSFAGDQSRISIQGGTHVPWSPSYHYLQQQWLPYLHQIGFHITLAMPRAGFYPPGGGHVDAHIQPTTSLQALQLTTRGGLQRVHGISGYANLDESVGERQRRRANQRLRAHTKNIEITVEPVVAISRGTFLVLLAEFEHSRWCYCALGAIGKRAEQVADEAVDALDRFIASGAAVERYLADQLLLPLALAPGTSRLYTECLSGHLQTNAEIIQQLHPARIEIDGQPDQPATVTIHGHPV
jgi:RNA 3'-terminal phosphate cyclase (ATP)